MAHTEQLAEGITLYLGDWDLSCVDWEDRIRAGRSLIPDLPLIQSEANLGLAFFDQLQLPDVNGQPRLGDAAGQWFRDIVRAMFGSWDPVAQQRHIREIFTMVPKGSSKTTYSWSDDCSDADESAPAFGNAAGRPDASDL
jgi:phage terminase large subunit-like protein